MTDHSAKPVIHIRDDNYSADYLGLPNPYFDWKRDLRREDAHLTVFSDNFLHEAASCGSAHKVAWLIEPPATRPEIYDFIRAEHRHFDLVFSHIESICRLDAKFAYCPFGTTWIDEKDWRVYRKSRNASAIVSEKNSAPGHVLRHRMVARYGHRIDVYGRAYRKIPNTRAGLKDYRYSIVIENSRVDSYFTEKLLDCFFCGTVPIYWGFPKVAEFFDGEGLIAFSELDELDAILDRLGPEDYERRLAAVHRNMELATPYARLEEQLWNRGLKRFFANE